MNISMQQTTHHAIEWVKTRSIIIFKIKIKIKIRALTHALKGGNRIETKNHQQHKNSQFQDKTRYEYDHSKGKILLWPFNPFLDFWSRVGKKRERERKKKNLPPWEKEETVKLKNKKKRKGKEKSMS